VVPGAVLVLKFCPLLTALAKPERFILADFDSIEPRIARLFISKCKDNIDLFKRAESGLRVQPVHDRDNGKVRCSKDDPGAISDVVKGDWGDEDDAIRLSVYFFQVWQ
jgi:hypothetical protein